jgi:FtsK/SpoIIIE family
LSKDVRTTVTSKWVWGGNGELRDAFPLPPWLFLAGKYVWWVITHPIHVGVVFLSLVAWASYGLLAMVGVLLVSGVLYVLGVGLYVGRGNPSLTWRERFLGVWRLWRLSRLWPEACEAGGVLTRRGGTALPLKRRRIESHGLTFLVRNGKGGRTVDDVRKGSGGVAAVLGCDSIGVYEESAALCQMTLSWGDPTTQDLTFADLPVSPYKYAAFGVSRDGQAASLATYLSVLCCGLSGSGKSSLVWAFLAGLLRDKVPFAVTVIDPAGGVEFNYLRKAPYLKKYVDKPGEVKTTVTNFRDAMRCRWDAMQDKGIRFHEPTEEEPLRILIIDELLLLGDILKEGANSPLAEVLFGGRKAAYIVFGLSQLSQVDAIGRVRDLFVQRVCLATKSREMTEAVLGPGAESEGARCSKITEDQAGVGYLMNGKKRQYIRFRSVYISDDDARLIASGQLPSTDGVIKAPSGMNASWEALRKRKTAVYWYYSVGDGRLIYVGIAVNPNERMPEHKKDWWWPQVDETKTRVQWYKTRDVAKKVETDFIQRYHPDGNNAENKGQDYTGIGGLETTQEL